MYVRLELLARDAGLAVARGDTVVIVDVLRCTSTIIRALAEGAKRVLPVKTLKEARRMHREISNSVLAGERGSVMPEGFTLGNSPLEFTAEMVGGRDVVLTTSSGTVALTNVMGGESVLVGSFLNARSVASVGYKISEEEGQGISIVLSGNRGRFSLEDFLGGGAIINWLQLDDVECSDAAQASLLAFKGAESGLLKAVQGGLHAKALHKLGLDRDVTFCSQLNKYEIVPRLEEGEIFLPDDR